MIVLVVRLVTVRNQVMAAPRVNRFSNTNFLIIFSCVFAAVCERAALIVTVCLVQSCVKNFICKRFVRASESITVVTVLHVSSMPTEVTLSQLPALIEAPFFNNAFSFSLHLLFFCCRIGKYSIFCPFHSFCRFWQ